MSVSLSLRFIIQFNIVCAVHDIAIYEGRTEIREQLFFACELGTADEGECGGR